MYVWSCVQTFAARAHDRQGSKAKATQHARPVCMDMYADMGAGMGAGMHAGMRVGMSIDMFVDMCVVTWHTCESGRL